MTCDQMSDEALELQLSIEADLYWPPLWLNVKHAQAPQAPSKPRRFIVLTLSISTGLNFEIYKTQNNNR